MKKTYIIPAAKTIVLAEKESLLVTGSNTIDKGDDIMDGEDVSGDSNRRGIWSSQW